MQVRSLRHKSRELFKSQINFYNFKFFFVNFRHQFEKQNFSMIMEIIAEL